MNTFIIKGHIVHTPKADTFEIIEDGYLKVFNGNCQWIKKELDKETQESISKKDIQIIDCEEHLIIPSFIDLHVHAPQFIQMGIGLHLPLIDWLDHYTFKIEERFVDANYARKCYPSFAKALYDNGSLRSVIFGTIHQESNHVLVEELSKLKLSALVGKVNMNRFTTVNLTETVEKSLQDTEVFIDRLNSDKNSRIQSIITPRFAPSCDGELLKGLGELALETKRPVQSHLSETEREIEWVKELFEDELEKDKNTYSDVYLKYGLLGETPTVMAHGIYLEEREIQLCKKLDVCLAHCPTSNMNLTSGIMPLTSYMDMGIHIGLGSDVGAGHTMAMNQVIVSAIQNAKMRHVIYGDRLLSESEGFYLATKGNGAYLEKVFTDKKIGSFEEGYSFDALIVQEEHPVSGSLTPIEQLQRFLYCGSKESIKTRYLEGEVI